MLGERAGSVARLERVAVLPSRQALTVAIPTVIWRSLWLHLYYGCTHCGCASYYGHTHSETVAILPLCSVLYLILWQGQGVGSAALATALQETDALGLAVFLATQVAPNPNPDPNPNPHSNPHFHPNPAAFLATQVDEP